MISIVDTTTKRKLKKTVWLSLFLGAFLLQVLLPPSAHRFFQQRAQRPILVVDVFKGKAYAEDTERVFVFGPYVPLSPGKYRVAFTLRTADSGLPQPVAKIEVVARRAQNKYASRTLYGTDFVSSGEYQDFDLQFATMLGERDFEFRIIYMGISRLWAEKISVTQLQGYSQSEAEGANLIKGYNEDKIVTKNFLKGSTHREISVVDPMLSRRTGYLVSDSRAASGRAWVAWPRMTKKDAEPKVPPGQPWKISGPWLLLILGLIVGCFLVPVLALLYKDLVVAPAVAGELARQLLERTRGLLVATSAGHGGSWIFLRKALVVGGLVAGTILSVFSEGTVLWGFTVRSGYFFGAYVVLSLFWGIGSMTAIGIGSLLLAGSPLLLIYQQEQHAATIGTIAYYFLIFGVVWRLKEYLAEIRLVEEAASAKVALERKLVAVTPEGELNRQVFLAEKSRPFPGSRTGRLHRKRKKIKHRLALVIVLLFAASFVTGIFFWVKPLGRAARSPAVTNPSARAGEPDPGEIQE